MSDIDSGVKSSAIVLGVGPQEGLGARLAMRFAELGLHVFVAGRTLTKVETIAQAIRHAGNAATAIAADATSEVDTIALFDAAEQAGPLEVAIYNAGNNNPGQVKDMTADYFEASWRVCCFGGFLFGREAARRMQVRDTNDAFKPTVLFTGASASLRGRANFGAFNSAKGALRNFAQALAKESGPEGLHVGHVVVDGPIAGEKIKRGLPKYAEQLGVEGMINLEGIVDGYEFLYKQPRQAWSFELDVRTSLERW